MLSHAKFFVLLVVGSLLPLASGHAAVIGGFEGTLAAGPFGVWQTDHAAFDPSAEAQPGLIDFEYLTNDPNTTASEGITQGSQSLMVEFYQWEADYKPYLSLTEGPLAETIIAGTNLQLDFTPIAPAAGWDDVQSWRQVLLGFSLESDGAGSGTPFSAFGKLQRDWAGTLDEFGNPLPNTVTFNFIQNLANDLNVTDIRTWKGWAQHALNLEAAGDDVDFDLVLVFQGRDIDENGDLIGFNPFAPDAVKMAIDNVRINGVEFPEDDADFDNDEDVDGVDFLTWQRGFGTTTGATNATGDTNNDGDVDVGDLSKWEADYGTGGLQAIAAVPEPTAAALLSCAALMSLVPRRRQR